MGRFFLLKLALNVNHAEVLANQTYNEPHLLWRLRIGTHGTSTFEIFRLSCRRT